MSGHASLMSGHKHVQCRQVVVSLHVYLVMSIVSIHCNISVDNGTTSSEHSTSGDTSTIDYVVQ